MRFVIMVFPPPYFPRTTCLNNAFFGIASRHPFDLCRGQAPPARTFLNRPCSWRQGCRASHSLRAVVGLLNPIRGQLAL